MPIPASPAIDQALLELLADGEMHDSDDILSSLADRLALTQADLSQRSKGGIPVFRNLVDFAKVRLGQQGLVRRVARKKYQIAASASSTVAQSLTEQNVGASNEPSAVDLGEEFPEERELKKALRDNIEQLEEGLKFLEEERFVKAGFIDITAEDKNGVTVVIELKKGEADRDAVGQIAAYMGDMTANGSAVRGMLIAYGFSHRAVAAAKMVHGLALHRYGYRFTFEKV